MERLPTKTIWECRPLRGLDRPTGRPEGGLALSDPDPAGRPRPAGGPLGGALRRALRTAAAASLPPHERRLRALGPAGRRALATPESRPAQPADGAVTPRARDAADRWIGLVIRLLPEPRAVGTRHALPSSPRSRTQPTAGASPSAVRGSRSFRPPRPALASRVWCSSPPSRWPVSSAPRFRRSRVWRRSPGSVAARGAFGPVRRGRVARAVRAGGFALACAIVLIDALQAGCPSCCSPITTGVSSPSCWPFWRLRSWPSAQMAAVRRRRPGRGCHRRSVAGAAAFALLPFAQNAPRSRAGCPAAARGSRWSCSGLRREPPWPLGDARAPQLGASRRRFARRPSRRSPSRCWDWARSHSSPARSLISPGR